jgi:hypothetical protein
MPGAGAQPAAYGYNAGGQPAQPAQPGQPPAYGYNTGAAAPPPPPDDFVVVNQGQEDMARAPQQPQYGAPPPPQQPQYGAPPQQYGQQPPQYGAPPPQYNQQPPQQYGQQPPQYGAPPTQVYQAAPPPAAPRKTNPMRYVLIAVALLAVVGVGAAGYIIATGNSPLASVPATSLLPPDTLAYVNFDPHPAGAQKAALDKMQSAFTSQPGWQAAVDKIKSQGDSVSQPITSTIGGCFSGPQAGTTPASFDEATGFLGHSVTLAMLPLTKDEITKLMDSTGENSGDAASQVMLPKLVMVGDLDVAAIAKGGLPGNLKKVTGASGKVEDIPVAEKYKEVDIRKISSKQCDANAKDQPAFLALIGSTAVLTFDQNTMHGAIDRYKDPKTNATLGASAGFTGLDAELPKERLGTLYLNLTGVNDIITVVTEKMQASMGDTGAPAVKMTKIGGAVLVSMSAKDDGMQIDSASDTQVDGQAVGTGAAPSADAINDIPADSWAFYSGADLKTIITQALDTMRKQGQGADLDEQLAGVRDQLGVDVEKDLLPLLSGDYMISVGGRKAEEMPILNGAMQLRLKPGDGAKLNSIVTKLNDSMQSQGGPAPETVDVAGTTLFRPEGMPGFYGLKGDHFYLMGTMDPDPEAAQKYAETVINGTGKGIGTDATVKARLAHLPANSVATLYVDISKIRQEGIESMLQGDSKTSYDSEVAPFVRPLQYLISGGTSKTVNSMNHGHGVVFLGISK